MPRPATLLAFLSTLCLCILSASAAWAQDAPAEEESEERADQVIVGLSAELAFPVSNFADIVSTGSGANVRVGYELHLGPIITMYDISASYLYFQSDTPAVELADYEIIRVMAGARAAYEYVLDYELFFRLGYGYTTGLELFNDPDQGIQAVSDNNTFDGLALEVGIGIEYPLLDQFLLGINLGYGHIFLNDGGIPTTSVELNSGAIGSGGVETVTVPGTTDLQWFSAEAHFAVGF